MLLNCIRRVRNLLFHLAGIDKFQIMREIPYVIRSRFLPVIGEHITRMRDKINAGLAIQISLDPGGYNGDVKVFIYSNNAHTFETDWHRSDATRFPQRIRSAATALQKCGFSGLFHIIYEDGVLAIRAINAGSLFTLNSQ